MIRFSFVLFLITSTVLSLKAFSDEFKNFVKFGIGNFLGTNNYFFNEDKIYFSFQDRMKFSSYFAGNISFDVSLPSDEYSFFRAEVFGTFYNDFNLFEIFKAGFDLDFGWGIVNHSTRLTNNGILELFFMSKPFIMYRFLGLSLGWYGSSTLLFIFNSLPNFGTSVGYPVLEPFVILQDYKIIFTYTPIFYKLSVMKRL